MCPECGNKESVLQSVLSDKWECCPELGGCGAVFDTPVMGVVAQQGKVEDAVRAMAEAIRRFEHEDCPLGQPSLLEMECRTAKLLDIIKNEIGRLTMLMSGSA
ncbi:MAG: hypothetical protein KAV82_06455 [Phycisphaerae bacterium]|nr:hypothetical protein [Phycisphaerae bacterium]